MSATNRMTDQEIADFIATYITGKDADKIAKMIYNTLGEGNIPKGGIVEKFVDADYGELVREDIVKLTLLLKGYFEKTGADASTSAQNAANSATAAAETAGSFDSDIARINRYLPTAQEGASSGRNLLRMIGASGDFDYLNSLHFRNNGDGSWKIYGTTPSDGGFRHLINSPGAIPGGLQAGKSYRIIVDSRDKDGNDIGDNVYLRITRYYPPTEEGGLPVPEPVPRYYYRGANTFNLLSNNTGIVVDIIVHSRAGTIAENAVFRAEMYATESNAEISDRTSQISKADDGTHFSGDVFVEGIKPLFIPRRTLTEADDLDEVTDPGWYYATLNHIPDHAPSIHTTVYLVFSNSAKTVTVQLGFNKMNHMYFRAKLADTASGYYGDADFGPWKRLAEAAEIPSGDDDEDTVSVGYNVDPGFIRGTDGRDVPPNTGTMVSYKRAHQMLDTRYTTLANTPSAVPPEGGAPITIRSATEYAGIPYSSAKEYEMYVGTDISFRTFMTAIHNPYSLQYTECIRGGNYTYNGKTSNGYGISGYNLQYHGGDSCGPYYGGVCSQFVWACFGVKNRWASSEFEYLAQQGILYIVPENSSGGARLMDIVQECRVWDSVKKRWKPTHDTVVTDIYRNERGVPQYIYVSECTTNGVYVKDGIVVGTFSGSKPAGSTACVGCRTTRYTAAEFDAYLAESHGRLFRYLKIHENLDYTPSEFVAVEGESDPGEYSYNDDVCTYAGDYAAFRVGFPVHVNYSKGGYTQAVVKRGETIVATISLPAEYNDTHSIDVSAYCGTAGKYTVHLTNGTNNSEPTHFEVIDTTTTVSGAMATQTDILTVTFNKNARPMYIELSNVPGGQRGLRPLTAKEIKAGTVTFNAYEYIASTTGSNYPTGNCVRVKYRGDYGNVVSELLPVEEE